MHAAEVAKWDIFEVALDGPRSGNPFLEVSVDAVFSFQDLQVRVSGFYDGDGSYKIRFMPETEGVWRFRTRSTCRALDGVEGAFECIAPPADSGGPVKVRDEFHFAYSNGRPYFPFGTTCYAWTHQPIEVQEQTLKTLSNGAFNKVRMCVFPKHYIYNSNEPLYDVFVRSSSGELDFDRPNVVAFQHLETQIGRLKQLGIQADLIIFHPYDRWGYCDMDEERDLRYLRYLVARLAAFSNVWWSLANEYDFLLDVKPMARWNKFLDVLGAEDPYSHLTSIHNGEPKMCFDHTNSQITHVCMQNSDVMRTAEWLRLWNKPLINDEPEYEGNIPRPWGNIDGRELVHRFWVTVMRGGYAGHGETFLHEGDMLWWSKGGVLRGESWKRVRFLRRLIEASVTNGLVPFTAENFSWEFGRVSGASDGHVRFIYFGPHQPAEWAIGLPKEDGNYDIDLIDIWEMTTVRLEKAPLPVSPSLRQRGGAIVGGKPEAAFGVKLPGKPYLALRVTRVQ